MGNIFTSLFGKSDVSDGSQEENHKDLVCGMKVNNDSIAAEYRGATYYFCSEHCKAQFITNPENFVD